MSQCLNQKSDVVLSFSFRDLLLGLGIIWLFHSEFLLIPVDYLFSFKKNTTPQLNFEMLQASATAAFCFQRTKLKYLLNLQDGHSVLFTCPPKPSDPSGTFGKRFELSNILIHHSNSG